jgi:hypothetical protein
MPWTLMCFTASRYWQFLFAIISVYSGTRSGTRFTPDHDQRNVASFAVTYAARQHGIWTSFSGRYESGVPLEFPDLNDNQLRALPGVNLVNFDTGRVKPWSGLGLSAGADLVRRDLFTIGAQVDVQNLADRDFAFNGAIRFPAHTLDIQD